MKTLITRDDLTDLVKYIMNGEKTKAIGEVSNLTGWVLLTSRKFVEREGDCALGMDQAQVTDIIYQQLKDFYKPDTGKPDSPTPPPIYQTELMENLVAVNMAMLAEVKEMNELLRDVMEGMEGME